MTLLRTSVTCVAALLQVVPAALSEYMTDGHLTIGGAAIILHT